MPFIVVYDANPLVGNTQRDLLFQVALAGLVQAAIKSGAQLIVTKDKDFTVDALRPWNIEAKTPDDYMLDLIDISEKIVWGCLQQIVNSRKQRPETVEDVLAQMERSGLVRSVAALRRNWT
jgi:hypothetical protein